MEDAGQFNQQVNRAAAFTVLHAADMLLACQAQANRQFLLRNATGTTGRLIEEVTNINIHKYLAGHLGGVQQLGAQISANEIDLVIFLRDPLTKKAHEPDVALIAQLCDEHNIPLATNLATAELLIRALERGDLDWREMYK